MSISNRLTKKEQYIPRLDLKKNQISKTFYPDRLAQPGTESRLRSLNVQYFQKQDVNI